MMYEPVNQCRCQAVIPEDLIPATKLQVRGGDDALLLVTVRDDGKEQFSRRTLEGHIPHLIEDEQLGAGDPVHQGAYPACTVSCQQLVGQAIQQVNSPSVCD